MLGAACSDGLATAPPGGRLTLVNATPDSIGYVALTQEDAALADPNPAVFPAASLGPRVVAPGASRAVPASEIHAYAPGSGVVFFVFRVANGLAQLSTSIGSSGAELRAAGFRVTVRDAAVRSPMVRRTAIAR